ncbi:hypothetical protein [Celeribacter halophilus]|uniref:hypothetical protein n=1 Tax=Celeribacter halophilus TaxID=576117 RepID=UPI003A8E8303
MPQKDYNISKVENDYQKTEKAFLVLLGNVLAGERKISEPKGIALLKKIAVEEKGVPVNEFNDLSPEKITKVFSQERDRILSEFEASFRLFYGDD